MNNVTDDSAGYSLGNRTNQPHHPDGWHPQRPADSDNGEAPPRGGPVRSGEHDRPKKN